MNSKHIKTLQALFKVPPPSNVRWSDIEKLFIHLGAHITEGRGSRVTIRLNGVYAVFHRPHPHPDTDKGAIMSVRRFLKNAGVDYDNEI